MLAIRKILHQFESGQEVEVKVWFEETKKTEVRTLVLAITARDCHQQHYRFRTRFAKQAQDAAKTFAYSWQAQRSFFNCRTFAAGRVELPPFKGFRPEAVGRSDAA